MSSCWSPARVTRDLAGCGVPRGVRVVSALGTEWSHDGDGWRMDVGGACPVQGDGLFDGRAAYFRARGNSWSLRVAYDADADPVRVGGGPDGVRGWYADGIYGGERFDASWMAAVHSREIVAACVAAIRGARSPGPGEVVRLDVSGVPTAPLTESSDAGRMTPERLASCRHLLSLCDGPRADLEDALADALAEIDRLRREREDLVGVLAGTARR